MSDRTSLGDRMKGYERAPRLALPRRMPVIIRVDGKAFHTLTRGCAQPFDPFVVAAMNQAAITLVNEAQGAVFAFVQSDEISVLLHNYKRLNSEAWFDNDIQKLCSISAAVAARSFTYKPALFDARCFVLPEAEVCNYFIWRQQDATRNSIQMAARAVFSHRECENKNTSELQDMLHARGINWNDYPTGFKRGRGVLRVDGAWCVDTAPPVFTQSRNYIEGFLVTEES